MRLRVAAVVAEVVEVEAALLRRQPRVAEALELQQLLLAAARGVDSTIRFRT
jgi:hypothetical protein